MKKNWKNFNLKKIYQKNMFRIPVIREVYKYLKFFLKTKYLNKCELKTICESFILQKKRFFKDDFFIFLFLR